MTPIPFVTLDDPHYCEAVQVSPLIRRVIARNPSKYTYLGTGTYIIGRGDVAVIDPGPLLDAHRDALTAALGGETVRTIVVTHCHGDHSPLAAWLRETTGAPTVAFGPHGAVDDEPDEPDPEDVEPAAESEAPDAHDEPKETLDLDFDPDVRVADGAVAATGPGYTLRAVHTPGHTSNHMCYALDEERALFTGDHVMGWSTTIVSPPDGDMRSYVDSLRKVQGRADATLWPTHGAPVTEPGPFLQAYLDHRLAREAQVLEMVRAGVTKIVDIVDVLYVDVKPELHKPARRSVLAHLVKLVDDGQVTCDTERPRVRSHYTPA